MKKLLILIVVALLLNGCIVYPGYDYGYDRGGYGYAGPRVGVFIPEFYGGYGYYHGHHGGYRY